MKPLLMNSTRRFVDGMVALTVGGPMDPATDVGPLATPSILETLERQIAESIAAGARALTGGFRLHRPGNFYAPTVLTDIPPATPAYSEELFGPVALLFRVKDIDTAIRQANDTLFGLGSTRLDQRPRRAGTLYRRDRSGDDLRQRDGRLRSAPALRRHQAFGLWP